MRINSLNRMPLKSTKVSTNQRIESPGFDNDSSAIKSFWIVSIFILRYFSWFLGSLIIEWPILKLITYQLIRHLRLQREPRMHWALTFRAILLGFFLLWNWNSWLYLTTKERVFRWVFRERKVVVPLQHKLVATILWLLWDLFYVEK